MQITAHMSEGQREKLLALAERRYGDREQESLGLIVRDALRWKMEQWDKYGASWGDRVWHMLAFHSPIPFLKKVGWGKLITSYLT